MVTAFANSSEVLDVVTPDVKHAVYHSKLVFIDLNDAPLTLGGSALAQVFDQIGDSCPSVDLGLLQRAFRMIQALIKQQLILAGHDRSDGGVQLFRPWENVARLNRSCERLGLPQLDPDDALQAIKEIVRVDQRWVPNDPGTSLYIRPFLYSTDPTLALHGVHEASFVIILSPSGSYFSDGLKPVPIMVETEDVRAVRGGTGEAKCGGNYGAANRAGDRAIEKGFSQVLWLDGVERKYVEEGGGMNVMFKINGTVVTPALTGSILRGVTRKSAIELLKSWGVPVEERLLSVDELFDAAASGALEEAWCIGTAAVISPIGELSWGDRDYKVNDNKIGALSQKLYDELTGIQWGTKPDPFGWVCPID